MPAIAPIYKQTTKQAAEDTRQFVNTMYNRYGSSDLIDNEDGREILHYLTYLQGIMASRLRIIDDKA